MLILKTTARFRKDYKRLKKQGKDMNLLQNVIDDLLAEKVLDKKYKDHALVGDYLGFRECHILPAELKSETPFCMKTTETVSSSFCIGHSFKVTKMSSLVSLWMSL